MRNLLVFLFVMGIQVPCWAGLVEIGLSANYKQTTFNEDNYNRAISYTGSFSYYFLEMSALEMSYTSGHSVLVAQPTAGQKDKYTTNFQLVGLDLVFSFADRKSAFQPYVKAGAAYIEKEFFLTNDTVGTLEYIDPQYGVVPSAGAGFKIRLSQNFSLKIGAEAWKTPNADSEDNPIFDFAGRAGISWIF